MCNSSVTYQLLSVIICTYNRSGLLPVCLRSLVEQTLESSQYEVIIVNNNSTDDTQEIVESFTRIHDNFRAVVETKQGLSHARNRGWREAQGTLVAYIDDDAKATQDWCERIVTAFQTVTPQPVAVGGEIRPFYETAPPEWISEEFEKRTWGDTVGFLQPPRARYGFSGSNMAFQKIVLERFGGFSSEYGMTGHTVRMGEDTELFSRLYEQHPWFWYDPAILVYHWTPVSIMKISYRFWRAFRSGEAIARMQNDCFSFRAFAVGSIGVVLLLLKMPYSLINAHGSFKMQIVKKIEELGHSLGFLFGLNSL